MGKMSYVYTNICPEAWHMIYPGESSSMNPEGPMEKKPSRHLVDPIELSNSLMLFIRFHAAHNCIRRSKLDLSTARNLQSATARISQIV